MSVEQFYLGSKHCRLRWLRACCTKVSDPLIVSIYLKYQYSVTKTISEDQGKQITTLGILGSSEMESRVSWKL